LIAVDDNRVKLYSVGEDDYINASYINVSFYGTLIIDKLLMIITVVSQNVQLIN